MKTLVNLKHILPGIFCLTVMSFAKAQTIDTLINRVSDKSFNVSIPVPDGNYRVTVTLGNRKKTGQTVVLAESRRLFTDLVTTRSGVYKTVTFAVNKHSPVIDAGTKVKLKPREWSYRNWDDSLTLSFCGPMPAVHRIRIEPADDVTTVFLCGNSTVVDQECEPWASWGQMITRWFDDKVAIANYAESGLSATSFLYQLRLDKILTQMKAGDCVIVEFGHNDEKEQGAGDGAWYSYSRNLKIFADRVREKGGGIVFCTPTARRVWAGDHRTISNTHGEYPEAMKAVARREGIGVIDLTQMTTTFYESLGEEGSKKALVHYPAGTFPGQEQALADNTHFNSFGAWEVSKMVIMGLKELGSPLTEHLRSGLWLDFNPAEPDDPDGFEWYISTGSNLTKPDGY